MYKILFFVTFLFCAFSTNSQITTFTGSFGFFGKQLNNNDIQFSLECSSPFDKERLSAGMKWRYFMGSYSGLNVEGFGRVYIGKKAKMYAYNDRWYLQAKLGYGFIKSSDDSFTASFNEKEKLSFVPIAGGGIGYKFLIKEVNEIFALFTTIVFKIVIK
jgi:hypothetical protein